MKNFVKENWYKLMIGSSMMMASFGFMIYTISPSFANEYNSEEKALTNNTFPSGNNYDFLVDSQNRVWYHNINDPVSYWYKSGTTLK